MLEAWVMLASLAAGGATDAGQCALIADDSRRLACYDALFRAEDPPAVPRAAEAAPRATAATPTAAAPPAPPEKDFGLTGQQRDERYGTPEEPDEIRAVVVDISESRVGKPTYTLDNGQRWRQIEATSRPALKVGRTVVIRKAVFGSFQATMPEVGGAPVRVRRAE